MKQFLTLGSMNYVYYCVKIKNTIQQPTIIYSIYKLMKILHKRDHNPIGLGFQQRSCFTQNSYKKRIEFFPFLGPRKWYDTTCDVLNVITSKQKEKNIGENRETLKKLLVWMIFKIESYVHLLLTWKLVKMLLHCMDSV